MVRFTPLALILTLVAVRPAGATTAEDICPGNPDPCMVTTNKVVSTGSFLNFGTRALIIDSGQLNVGAGTMVVLAGSVTIGPTGKIVATAGDQGPGTAIVIATGDITIQRGPGGGDAGQIDVHSSLGGGVVQLCTPSCTGGVGGGNVTIDGEILAGSGSASFGGTIDIVANSVTVTGPDRGNIDSTGGGDGGGGSVTITTAAAITVNGTINVAGGQGGGGDVLLDAGTNVTTGATALINANAREGLTAGDGFIVEIFTRGSATIGGVIDGRGRGNNTDLGGGGADVDILVDGTATVTASIMTDGGDPDGDAGDIDIDAELGIDATGSQLSAKTLGSQGGGGTVTFTTAGTAIAGGIDVRGGAAGGEVIVDAGGNAELRGVIVASGTGGVSPVGGTVDVIACDVTIAAGASVTTLGEEGLNILRGGDQITVNGPLAAGKMNVLQYRSPARLPVIGVPPMPAPTLECRNDLPQCGLSGLPLCPAPTTTTSTVPGATTTTTTTVGGGTSTTTAGSTTTSSTTPSGASTTSTTLPRPCDPIDAFACDDGQSCTADVCDPATNTCVSAEEVGYGAVHCRLGEIAALLGAAAPDSVGGTRLQRKLTAKINKAIAKALAAERAKTAGSVRQERKRLGAATGQLNAFTGRVQRGKDRGQVETAIADQMLALAGETSARLQGLQP